MHMYNEKKQSKVQGNLLKMTIDFGTLCKLIHIRGTMKFKSEQEVFFNLTGKIILTNLFFRKVMILCMKNCTNSETCITKRNQ